MDRVNDRVYIGFDPTGHTIEALQCSTNLVVVNGSNVTVQGGVIEHALFACLFVSTPLGGPQLSNIHILDVEAGWSHRNTFSMQGDGADGNRENHINALLNSEAGYCEIHHGGKYGYQLAWADGCTYHHLNVHHGNFLHFGHMPPDPTGPTFGVTTTGQNDEGTSKHLSNKDCTFEHNFIHDGDGADWWDFYSHGTVVQESVYQDMYSHGTVFEACPGPMTARRNAYIRCGKQSGWNANPSLWPNDPVPYTNFGYNAGGSAVWTSPNVTIDRCRYVDCGQQCIYVRNDNADGDGITTFGRYNGHEISPTKNLLVTHCQMWFKHVGGTAANQSSLGTTDYGAVIGSRDAHGSLYLQTNNNKFDFNEYHTPPGGRTNNGIHAWWFWPSGSMRTFVQWRAGQAAPNAPASFYDPNGTWVADYTTDPAET
jgi:hypothetical protein